MKVPEAVPMAAAALALAVGGSAAVWLAVRGQGRPLNVLEMEYVVAMPVLAAAALLLAVVVRKAGPRPFLTLLWFAVGVQAGHVAFAFVETGLFYLPAVALAVVAVLRLRPAGRGIREPPS